MYGSFLNTPDNTLSLINVYFPSPFMELLTFFISSMHSKETSILRVQFISKFDISCAITSAKLFFGGGRGGYTKTYACINNMIIQSY